MKIKYCIVTHIYPSEGERERERGGGRKRGCQMSLKTTCQKFKECRAISARVRNVLASFVSNWVTLNVA